MIDFLWHLRGSVEIDPGSDQTAVLDRIEQMLEKERKPVIERGSRSIVFEEPLWSNFWGPNWRATVIYDQGRFWLDSKDGRPRLRYDVRSLHAFAFCSLAAATFFVFGSLDGDFRQGLLFAAVAFGWVYGMNIVLALARVPALIRRTVRTD